MDKRESREQAFILLFEASFQPDCTIEDIISIGKESGIIEEDDFSFSLVRTAVKNLETIDSVIEQNLKSWKMSRASRTALAVLRLAVCEILYFGDIPTGASINEAVEISKKYASADEYSFVNGVLGAVAKSVEDQ